MQRQEASKHTTSFQAEAGAGEVVLAGVALKIDPLGALVYEDERMLIVADLHLEKGSSYAKRGVMLPPYDTGTTLARLAVLIARWSPRRVIALGDSFHDDSGPERMATSDRASLAALQAGRDWIWIAGNHDPEPAAGVGGTSAAALAIGALSFCHQPQGDTPAGEIAGHLHPVARVSGRGRTVSRRCFASNADRMVMPAFGAYAGGLNVRHRAFADVFGTLSFTAYMLGEGRLYSIAAKRCLGD